MITVYHLENSRSERVIWLMEELGLSSTLGLELMLHLDDPVGRHQRRAFAGSPRHCS